MQAGYLPRTVVPQRNVPAANLIGCMFPYRWRDAASSSRSEGRGDSWYKQVLYQRMHRLCNGPSCLSPFNTVLGNGTLCVDAVVASLLSHRYVKIMIIEQIYKNIQQKVFASGHPPNCLSADLSHREAMSRRSTSSPFAAGGALYD